MAAVTVDQVYKSFGSVHAVQGVSFDVAKGEMFGLLGPNGAGKTTTIRMMMDIYRPDSGSIAVLGGPMAAETKDRVGYLPEERGLYQEQRLEPTLTYLATLKGLGQDDARSRLGAWLERFDLSAQRQQKIRELSKGMQQKAQLIATLIHEPDLIVIDEPFSGLDPVNTRLVKDVLQEQCQAGRTVIMSTHQMHQVEALCSRIVLIDRGKTVLYGRVSDIKHNAAGNAIRVSGEGELCELHGVLATHRENGGWRLALDTGVSPRDVLQAIIAQDAFRVESFEIASPSLEDIFVSVVGSSGEEPADA